MAEYQGEERRVDHTALVELIRETIKETVSQIAHEHPLSPEEVTWVRLAIQAEAKRAAFRQAVIDKSITSLIVAMLGALGLYVVDYINAHWVWSK